MCSFAARPASLLPRFTPGAQVLIFDTFFASVCVYFLHWSMLMQIPPRGAGVGVYVGVGSMAVTTVCRHAYVEGDCATSSVVINSIVGR
jgi:hypothetical protein